MSLPLFMDYSARDAVAFARALLDSARAESAKDTRGWTEWILGRFASAAGPGVVIDARPSETRGTRGEFLVDLTHSTFPRYEAVAWNSVAYWKTAYQGPLAPRLRLAMESERGSARSSALNVCRVMEDAAKLFVLHADVKAMVFASCGPTNRDEILALAHAMAKRDPTGPTCWLWIDLPWADVWTGLWGPGAWIADRGALTTIGERRG